MMGMGSMIMAIKMEEKVMSDSFLGTFFEMFEYGFMRNALLAGILAAIAFGIVGTYIVVKRIVLITGGVAHASFGGVGMSFYLGWDAVIGPIIGASIFALSSALGIGLLSKETLEREETTIGIVWALGMAMGAFFMRETEGYAFSPSSYLFGNILMIKATDIYLLVILDIVVLVSAVLFYYKMQATAFDEEFAMVSGVRTLILHLYFLCLVAMTIVLLIKFMGVILVLAMLTIPPSLVGRFTHDLRRIMGYSSILSAIFIVIGLWTSFHWDWEVGATIVIEAAVVYLIVAIGLKLKTFLRRKNSRAKHAAV